VLARHFPVAACVMYTPSDAGLCWAPGWRAGWRGRCGGGTCVTCEGREGPPGGTQGSVSAVSPGHVLARHFPVAACVMYTPSDAGLCWAPGCRDWRASEVEAASFLELHLCRHLRHIRSSVISVASLPAPAMCVLFSS